MANIGEPKRVITIEPISVPEHTPATPAPAPAEPSIPTPEREPVPA